mmetsp:Transcript_2594/g.6630  ORF Transcript_2594/g.6630 Transcript_2594/m.6630 type:complete len:282 (-) Transcript_2594:3320-4165(-)
MLHERGVQVRRCLAPISCGTSSSKPDAKAHSGENKSSKPGINSQTTNGLNATGQGSHLQMCKAKVPSKSECETRQGHFGGQRSRNNLRYFAKLYSIVLRWLDPSLKWLHLGKPIWDDVSRHEQRRCAAALPSSKWWTNPCCRPVPSLPAATQAAQSLERHRLLGQNHPPCWMGRATAAAKCHGSGADSEERKHTHALAADALHHGRDPKVRQSLAEWKSFQSPSGHALAKTRPGKVPSPSQSKAVRLFWEPRPATLASATQLAQLTNSRRPGCVELLQLHP